MEWQHGLTWSAIALAAAFIAWRAVGVLRASKEGCGGGCGCTKSATSANVETPLIPPERLVLRDRSARDER